MTDPKELLSRATLEVLPVMEAFEFSDKFMRVQRSVGVLPALLFAMVIILFCPRSTVISCRPLAGWVWSTIWTLPVCLQVLLLERVLYRLFATTRRLSEARELLVLTPLGLLLKIFTRPFTLKVAVVALFAIIPILTFVRWYLRMVVGILGWTGLVTVVTVRNRRLPVLRSVIILVAEASDASTTEALTPPQVNVRASTVPRRYLLSLLVARPSTSLLTTYPPTMTLGVFPMKRQALLLILVKAVTTPSLAEKGNRPSMPIRPWSLLQLPFRVLS